MSRKIAVVVRDRQVEALRMAIGLTLVDDVIDIFVLNRKLERSDKTNLNIETIQDLEMNIYSNLEQGEDVKFLSDSEFADSLLQYDHVLPY